MVGWAAFGMADTQPAISFRTVQIHCPDPATITYTAIPWSIHGFYTAESDGVGFWGMDISILEPGSMMLAVAELASVNDYWSFACVYEHHGLVLNMSSHTSPAFQQCHLSNGEQRCEGSRDDCFLICPEIP
jgi:hypothetical protein